MTDYLKYKDYLGTVSYSAEDELFYGSIFGVNDLVNFEGASVSKLKRAFQEAVDDYLELCSELGKSPEKSYKGTFNVRVPATPHRQAALLATQNNMALNEFVKTALIFAVEHERDIAGRTS